MSVGSLVVTVYGFTPPAIVNVNGTPAYKEALPGFSERAPTCTPVSLETPLPPQDPSSAAVPARMAATAPRFTQLTGLLV